MQAHECTNHTTARMALPPTTAALEDDANWAVERATALPEVWALVAEHSDGLVDVWRLMRVCRASRAGAKEFLNTLPGLVVCGGRTSVGGESLSDVWRLDLATMRWEPMPALVTGRYDHARCAVRGALVVLGGFTQGGGRSSSVEMLSEEGGAFVDLPPLSCGGIWGAAAVAVGESDSAAGQVLLLGGVMEGGAMSRTVHLVDLATGVCTPGRPDLLRLRFDFAAAGLPGGGIVCAGGGGGSPQSAEMWGPPVQGAPDAAWTWRQLPALSVGRGGCRGCVMSDGRFAVLGGWSSGGPVSSCEALVVDGVAHWEPLPPMHDSRAYFACAAVAGCVIVAGGIGPTSAEVYDESRNRWLRLPHDLPYENELRAMGSALL